LRNHLGNIIANSNRDDRIKKQGEILNKNEMILLAEKRLV
jgi:hypothetical protein